MTISPIEIVGDMSVSFLQEDDEDDDDEQQGQQAAPENHDGSSFPFVASCRPSA